MIDHPYLDSLKRPDTEKKLTDLREALVDRIDICSDYSCGYDDPQPCWRCKRDRVILAAFTTEMPGAVGVAVEIATYDRNVPYITDDEMAALAKLKGEL